jgi:hypothetical protein
MSEDDRHTNKASIEQAQAERGALVGSGDPRGVALHVHHRGTLNLGVTGRNVIDRACSRVRPIGGMDDTRDVSVKQLIVRIAEGFRRL